MDYNKLEGIRTQLLFRYNSLERKVKREGIDSRLKQDYSDLEKHYETFKKPPLSKTHLKSSNTAFSERLSKFEKLLDGK